MIRLVVFDAYGTLFDVHSVGALAESLFPGQGQALSLVWRDKQIEYSRLISLSDPLNPLGSRHYQPFWDITRLALQYACQRLSLELTPAKQKQLIEQDRDLKRRQREFQEDLGARKNEENQMLFERAGRAVKQVAESEKYDLVLQDAAYFNPKHDITEKVIKALNASVGK
jgi:FMN phosphatase YigB (HAD superfamily)